MAKSSNHKKTNATQKLIDNVKIAKLKSKELEIPISETSLLPTSVKTSVYMHTNSGIRHTENTWKVFWQDRMLNWSFILCCPNNCHDIL